MSFRRRLSFFFVVIVIVPMLAVGAVLFSLIDQSENGQADARVAEKQSAALAIYSEAQSAAAKKLRVIAKDAVFTGSLQTGDLPRANKRARQFVQFRGIARVMVVPNGKVSVQAGDPTAIAPDIQELTSTNGRSFGLLEVSVMTARAYAERVRRLTGLEVVVRSGDRLLYSTIPSLGTGPFVQRSRIKIDGHDYRVSNLDPDPQGFSGQHLQITVLGARAVSSGNTSRLLAAGILVGFFLLALVCALLVSRSLQQQIAGFLEAARRLGGGDFSAAVPTVGNDEFAALGEEFNKMSRQLATRLEELRTERERVQGSMRRLGEAVASNLDRDALLELVVRTAVDGVAAQAGRARVYGPGRAELDERARFGTVHALVEVLDSAERDALESFSARESNIGGAHAIAHPLRGADGPRSIAGVVSVGRADRPFTKSERELFHYLAAQAAVSLENVEMYDTVARESVTDDLTGLANRRGFADSLTREIDRSKRFGTKLGLVMLDLDDFKDINDRYGHQQGDVVLREVARVLRESSREVDAPARYGGEELAVVLPGTDLEGAYNLAERVRDAIGRLRVPLLAGSGSIGVTASFGVAALPETAGSDSGLIAAADDALYKAKHAGKNMSVRAQ